MSKLFPETTAAWRRLKWNLRALACEILTSWAIAVCPEGYTPAFIEGVLDGVREHEREKTLTIG